MKVTDLSAAAVLRGNEVAVDLARQIARQYEEGILPSKLDSHRAAMLKRGGFTYLRWSRRWKAPSGKLLQWNSLRGRHPLVQHGY